MAECISNGYSSRTRAIEGPSLLISDFLTQGYSSEKKEFTETDKKIFYLNNMKDAKTTVLLCELQLSISEEPDPIKHRLISTSGDGKHAEEVAISDIKKVIAKAGKTVEEISIIMLISYSPCFKCREELQYYFTTGLKGKIRTFTLRIGCLYQDCQPSDEAERKLAFWKNDLEMQGVRVYLEAINVVRELPMSVNTKKREKLDDTIREHIENIETRHTDVNKLLCRVYSKNRKTHFISENGEQMILGELHTSGVTEEGLLRPTMAMKLPKVTADKQGRIEEESIIAKARSSMPGSWELIWKSLLLVCVHVPTKKCRDSITDFLTTKTLRGKKNRLVLHLANIPAVGDPCRESFVTWIKNLELHSIDVSLQPLYTSQTSRSTREQARYATLNHNFVVLTKELESWSFCSPDREDLNYDQIYDDTELPQYTPPRLSEERPPSLASVHESPTPSSTLESSLTSESSHSIISISSDELSPNH